MGPVPKDNQTSPEERDTPDHSEELDTPNHPLPPAFDSSSDEEDEGDSDGEGLPNDGYVLLPQDPEEEEEGGGDGEETPHPQAFPPLSALEGESLPAESMTEVRGAGIDVTQAVAEGNVHPAFAASFPDNKVPVHLQVPNPPKAKPEDILWNHATPEPDRLQMDSAQLSRVKSAMAGFQLPKANIPDWAQHIPEDQWKQQLISSFALATPTGSSTSSGADEKKNASKLETCTDAGKEQSQWPGESGT